MELREAIERHITAENDAHGYPTKPARKRGKSPVRSTTAVYDPARGKAPCEGPKTEADVHPAVPIAKR